MIIGKGWGLCGDDAVSDNDTSGVKLIRSEKIVITYGNSARGFLHVMTNGAVSRQPPAGYNCIFF